MLSTSCSPKRSHRGASVDATLAGHRSGRSLSPSKGRRKTLAQRTRGVNQPPSWMFVGRGRGGGVSKPVERALMEAVMSAVKGDAGAKRAVAEAVAAWMRPSKGGER